MIEFEKQNLGSKSSEMILRFVPSLRCTYLLISITKYNCFYVNVSVHLKATMFVIILNNKRIFLFVVVAPKKFRGIDR